MFHHGIQNRQELAHAGGQRDFRRFPCRSQTLIKPHEHRVVSDCDQRTHVQGGPDMGATAPDGSNAAQGPTSPMKGSDPDQGREALAAQGASRWEVEQQGAGTHRAKAGYTAKQCLALAPDGAGPQGRIQLVIEGHQACVEPGNVCLYIGPQARGCPTETVLFSRPHGHELSVPREYRAQLLRLRVGQGAPHRTYGICQMRQRMGVKTIRLGKLARGFGKVTRLAGIDAHDGQAHRGQRGNHGALVAPCRFEYHELRGNLLQSRDEGSDLCIIAARDENIRIFDVTWREKRDAETL
jgi:hypothetical protein